MSTELYTEIAELKEALEDRNYRIQVLEAKVEMIQKRCDYFSNETTRLTIEELPYAKCYKAMQEGILGSPMLMEDWQRFCLMLNLVDPDKEKYDMLLRR